MPRSLCQAFIEVKNLALMEYKKLKRDKLVKNYLVYIHIIKDLYRYLQSSGTITFTYNYKKCKAQKKRHSVQHFYVDIFILDRTWPHYLFLSA